MKVFLDANILFSAANVGSGINTLVHTLIRHHLCVTNQHALQEASRNLNSKRAAWVEEFTAIISKIPIQDSIARVSGVPDKDVPILGGAVSGECTHLVTGDLTDFGHLIGKNYQGVLILTPRMLTDEMVRLGLAADPKG